jgi:hypothetical protein
MSVLAATPARAPLPHTAANWMPVTRLGATSPGGLALPAANPTPAQLYAPRGVFINDDVLVVADSGNHRVLIWHGLPTRDEQAADVVIGQPDFYSEGEKLLRLPTGIGIYDGRLFVADAWHHRILIWDALPTHNNQPPDHVLGQDGIDGTVENRGGAIDARGFYWPYAFAYLRGVFYVADTGNRRVLAWQGLPAADQPADVVVGQDGPHRGEENRGVGVGAASFRWPHGFAQIDDMLYIADAGNHRILGWRLPLSDRPADVVIGQEDFATAREFAYVKQGPSRLRFPYAITAVDGALLAADTANNRILSWSTPPREGAFAPADAVLGQTDFDGNGENRWKAVAPDTLCWPYGIHAHAGHLAVADSGNNRVMIWRNGGAQCV